MAKELSYNNINDADAALSIVKEFTEPAVVAVKHMNPCGVGVGTDIHEAYTRAYEADPVSILEALLQRIVKLIKLQLKSYTKFLRDYYRTFFLERSFRSTAK